MKATKSTSNIKKPARTSASSYGLNNSSTLLEIRLKYILILLS